MKKFLTIFLLSFLLLTSCNLENSNDPENEPAAPVLPEVDNHGNILDYISKEGDVPLIRINTENEFFPVDKENYVKGNLEIVEQPNENNVLFSSQPMGIRLRGNSTLESPKKAFRIKFDSKQSLFDLPAAKSWVLLANYYDKSNLRNYLAYLTANKLTNLNFQPSSIFVEVEFNGMNLGLYLLCEQMQTGKGRVDIEQDEFDENNGSYFFELDFEDRILADGLVKNVSYFESSGMFFALKYPDEEDMTYNRCLTIKSFMDTVFMKMKNSTNYETVMDVDSFIDYYLIQELFKNVDGFQSSVYFYVENKKLYAGPVWDFDIGLSVVGYNNVDHSYDHYVKSKYWMREYSPFYKMLFNDPKFVQKLKERYTEVRPILIEIFEEIKLVETYLTDDFERNEDVWPIPGYTYTWIAERYSHDYASLTSTKQHISFLKKEISNQLYLLDIAYLIEN